MRAAVWRGKRDVRVEDVAPPTIVNPRDAIVRVTTAAISRVDLDVYAGRVPSIKSGDVLGHEFMGEIVDVGPEVCSVRPGDRVVVSSIIACGACWFCKRGSFALCDNSNPNAVLADKVYGHASAGMFGSARVFGGYAGGQAELVRVPFADVGCLPVPKDVDDEKVVLLSDALPAAWMAAENAGIAEGDVVAVFGTGPVGQLAIRCAFVLGAQRVIAVDRDEKRLELATAMSGAEPVDSSDADVLEAIDELTGGRGPDSCIETDGLDFGAVASGAYERLKSAVASEERASALKTSILACRKGGTISVAGMHGGTAHEILLGVAFNKGLTLKMGPVHTPRLMKSLLDMVLAGTIDPSFVITHRMRLDDAPSGYDAVRRGLDGCLEVVLRP